MKDIHRQENIQKIWDYYAKIADVAGRDKDGKVKDYSLSFFFEKSYEQIKNDLTDAFFGITETNWENIEEDLESEKIIPYCCTENALYPAQIAAILHALNHPISLIQGPPGTGKTEMILNLLSVIHSLYPQKTIAVVSSNFEAVKNITDEITEKDSVNENIKKLHDSFAILGSKKKRRECSQFEDFICDEELYLADPAFLEKYPVFSSTIHSLRKIFGKGFHQQFDYVIVDECSQISIMLGVIAMSSAKQLVLVGDNKQIPAIINRQVKEINNEFAKNNAQILADVDIYMEKDEKSFLSVCETVFRKNINSMLLNQHYRCHPSIIGFCNEYVYDNSLMIMTERRFEDEFKIRAVWYEGDYYENIRNSSEEEEKNTIDDYRGNDIKEILKKSGKRNLRQLKIFMEEEWPEVKKKVDNKLSVCVLSPYRFQLELLRQMLKDKLAEENKGLTEEMTIEGGLEDNRWGSDKRRDIPCLTIHKSQGRGYDIVYLFTVEDCGSQEEWPWCQKKRTINVAVSRAKKEFCIISSSQWLPADMINEDKPDYKLPLLKPSKSEQSEDEQDQLFYCKLLDYVDKKCPKPQGEFGLHRSKIRSVFDKVPQYRDIYATGKNYDNAYSAPARCMRDALVEEFGGEYTILSEVPLKEIIQTETVDCSDKELLAYKERSKLDFVLCKENEIRLILEVDGAKHRDFSDKDQQERDKKKDIWLKEILHVGGKFLRLPTDGTTSAEIDEIKGLLENGNNDIVITLDDKILEKGEAAMTASIHKDSLIKEFKQIMKKNFEEFKIEMEKAKTTEEKGIKLKEINKKMNYKPKGENKKLEDISYEEKLGRQFYLCRYGVAYAFEYAMMYDIVMSSYQRESNTMLGVFSFGCGSKIDAWSMAYAQSYLAGKNPLYENYKLYYKGIDVVEWEDFIESEKKFVESVAKDSFKNYKFEKYDINSYIENRLKDKVFHNILMFPKILNELRPEEIETITESLSKCNFELDEYYICVSHSRSDIQEGMKNVEERRGLRAVQNMVDAINADGTFEVCSDIEEMLGEAHDGFKKRWLGDGKDKLVHVPAPKELSAYHCYTFGSNPIENDNDSDPTLIYELNSDFQYPEIRKYLYEEIKPSADKVNVRVMQNIRVSQIVFQIIRLKRKKTEKED